MKDGGPAFPVPDIDGSAVCEGMTLRDYFAAKAMQGMLAYPHASTTAEPEAYAEAAYEIADAMIQERSKT